jgi:hypothetical protein
VSLTTTGSGNQIGVTPPWAARVSRLRSMPRPG